MYSRVGPQLGRASSAIGEPAHEAETACDAYFTLDNFVADCGNNNNGGGGEEDNKISCSCCTTCCDTGDPLCNTYVFNWRGNLDPSWHYGYRKQRYSYSSPVWVAGTSAPP